ncbi:MULTISPECIES: TadE family protein [unclassified Streptomyces]|uniref:TadE family protein n=1 Tax=unclassified Streptomyces TaxID=2593676 RepID=UPI0004C7BDD9|nr:TadE family protein [Streptomyces sp. NRRL S-118]
MRAIRYPRQERGQAAIEYVGMLGLLLFVAMAVVQLGLAVYAAQQAGTASRAAARAVSLGEGSAQQAGSAAMSDWLEKGATFRGGPAGDEVTVEVTVAIPSVVPGIDFGPVRKSTTMPKD